MARRPTLRRELIVVRDVEYGMRECIRMKKPVSAALVLASEPEDTHVEEGGLGKKTIRSKLK